MVLDPCLVGCKLLLAGQGQVGQFVWCEAGLLRAFQGCVGWPAIDFPVNLAIAPADGLAAS